MGYDEKHGLLEVQFHNGRTYYYLSVPGNVYESLMAADSIGGYFNENIRKNYRTIQARRQQATPVMLSRSTPRRRR